MAPARSRTICPMPSAVTDVYFMMERIKMFLVVGVRLEIAQDIIRDLA